MSMVLNKLEKKLNCLFISDLPRVCSKKDLLEVLTIGEEENFCLDEWNDAIRYVLRTECTFFSPEEIKEFLLA